MRARSISLSAKVKVALTFHPKAKRNVDEDNAIASMKWALDGIAQALGVDDSRFALQRPVIAEPIKGGRVIVEIGGEG